MTDYGDLLNTVAKLPAPCPRGHRDEQMRVYTHAATWACGAVRRLPPITTFAGERLVTPPARARCPVCGRSISLRRDRLLRGHRGDTRRPCDGSGQAPRRAAA